MAEAPNTPEVQGSKPMTKKAKTILGLIIAVAVVFAICAIVYGVNYVIKTEGSIDSIVELKQSSDTPDVYFVNSEDTIQLIQAPAKGPTQTPETPQDTIEYLAYLYSKATDPNSVKISITNSIDIPDDSIVLASDETGLLEDLKYAHKGIVKKLSEFYESKHVGVFGEDFTQQLPLADFSQENVISANCTIGKINDDDTLTDTDYHYIDIVFPDEQLTIDNSDIIYRVFSVNEDVDASELIIAQLSEFVQLNESSIECTGFEIKAKANRFTNLIDYAEYIRHYNIKASVQFIGDLAGYGEQEIEFEYSLTKKFDFSFAGIFFNQPTFEVNLNDQVEIPYTIVAEEADEDALVLTWSTSDESIASVTKDGYITGVSASAEPVTIYVSATYLGVEHISACEVTVLVPVTKILQDNLKLELSAGETKQLNYTIYPNNATITDVMWFSSNEDVATVDENGNVTAVGSGTASIYVVTTNEHFKSTCKLTVK